jgi:hypothetical protein
MNNTRKAVVVAAMLGATLTGGAIGASFVSGTASAQTSSSSDATTTAPAAPDHGAPKGPHQANGITEELLTGDTAASVTAAAQTAVPGATIDRVETDAEGATYEAHVTKSDGSKATVKVNADFSVASNEEGIT